MQSYTLEQYQQLLLNSYTKAKDEPLVSEPVAPGQTMPDIGIIKDEGEGEGEEEPEIQVFKPAMPAPAIPYTAPAPMNINYNYAPSNRRTQPVTLDGKTYISDKAALWSMYRKLNYPKYKVHNPEGNNQSFTKSASAQWKQLTDEQKREAVAKCMHYDPSI